MRIAKKLTQMQLIDNYIKQITEHYERGSDDQCGLSELLHHLERVVDEAQNSPPQGEADGSVGRESWTRAAAVARALRALIVACDDWKRS